MAQSRLHGRRETHEFDAGTPQGGVISPLLANLYLNEMDWEWDLHGIRFVRYADDFLLFANQKRTFRKQLH